MSTVIKASIQDSLPICHSREGGNPSQGYQWIPAFAGMTRRSTFESPLVILIKITLLILFLLIPIPTTASCTVTDDSGQIIHLPLPAKRIISLAPDITENLYAIGAGSKLIAVIKGSDYPPAALSLPQVGSYTGLDLERIISLHPDLIITWSGTFSRALSTLKKFNIPIYTTEPKHLEDIPRELQNLGCLTATEKTANQAAQNFSKRLAAISKQYQTQHPLTVFYQIGTYSLITINKTSWINQVITLCGGRNIFANATLSAPEVTWESVITANPQIIISDVPNTDWKKRWSKWPTLTAVKNNALYAINPDLIDRASPRLLDGAVQICEAIDTQRKKE